MSNKQGNKKLNRLNLNKETISDLDVPQGQDIVGGKGETRKATCATKDDRPVCQTITCPIEIPRSHNTCPIPL